MRVQAQISSGSFWVLTFLTNRRIPGSISFFRQIKCETAGALDKQWSAQLLDYLYSEDGILLANYGVEGETFNYDENGDPQLSDLVINNPDGLNFAIAVIKYTSSSDFCSILDPVRNTLAYTDAQKASIDIWARTDESHLAPGTDWSTDAQVEYAESLSNVTSYCSTAVMQFVTGDRSMDQWDDFMTELEGSFGDEIDRCTELYQQAVDSYLGKAA